MLSIDRFEEEYAVIIDDEDNCFNLSINKLPKDAKEGSIIVEVDGKYEIDYNKTNERKQRIAKLEENIWE